MFLVNFTEKKKKRNQKNSIFSLALVDICFPSFCFLGSADPVDSTNYTNKKKIEEFEFIN